MKGFIRLTDRHGNSKVNINIKHIVSINDLRTDKVIAKLDGWQWTVVNTVKTVHEVKETEDEIFRMIEGLL